MSYDIQDACLLQKELLNIRNVIQLTKDNLSVLKEKFKDEKDLPSMYISEHQELTSKLQKLTSMEVQLNQQLNETRRLEKSCAKFVRAYLPNKQRTSVQIKTGIFDACMNVQQPVDGFTYICTKNT